MTKDHSEIKVGKYTSSSHGSEKSLWALTFAGFNPPCLSQIWPLSEPRLMANHKGNCTSNQDVNVEPDRIFRMLESDIPLIYHLSSLPSGGAPYATTFYGNQKQPLIRGFFLKACIFAFRIPTCINIFCGRFKKGRRVTGEQWPKTVVMPWRLYYSFK